MVARLIASLTFFALLAAPAAAQPPPRAEWQGSQGWSPNGPYERLYDAQTVTTVRGRVERVDAVQPFKRMCPAVRLQVRQPTGALTWVHLGPDWFVDRQDVRIRPGDQVAVTGSEVTLRGRPVLIAARVDKGSDTLVLRDEDGTPAWRGWRGPQQPRAAGPRGTGGWGPGDAYARQYDPSKETVVRGEVTEIERFTPRRGMSEGVHASVRTDDGRTVDVHLGPAWFLERQEMDLQVGAQVEVRGARVGTGVEAPIIAREVQTEAGTLQLRDARGVPAWSGWRGRAAPGS